MWLNAVHLYLRIGCIGGNNAHASNIVTALFLATGQDPAQNGLASSCFIEIVSIIEIVSNSIGFDFLHALAVEGSSCFTILEKGEEEGDL